MGMIYVYYQMYMFCVWFYLGATEQTSTELLFCSWDLPLLNYTLQAILSHFFFLFSKIYNFTNIGPIMLTIGTLY